MSDHIILHMQSLVSAASSLFLSQIQYSSRRCAIAPPYHITVKTERQKKSVLGKELKYFESQGIVTAQSLYLISVSKTFLC